MDNLITQQKCPVCRQQGRMLGHGTKIGFVVCTACGLEIGINHLKSFNEGYNVALKELKADFQNVISQRDTYRSEAQAAARLLWASIQTFGGEVNISQETMMEAATKGANIDSSFDSETRITTIRTGQIKVVEH